jgi:peptidoglycan L-alanyl-D-glutamate endopeptidase CwlK
VASRDLSLCCSILREFIPELISEWSSGEDTELRIIQALRTDEEQEVLYAQGRTTPGKIVTNDDGFNTKSKHQKQVLHGEDAAHAVDLGMFLDGAYITQDTLAYRRMAKLGEALGLRSGYRYGDLDHFNCLGV